MILTLVLRNKYHSHLWPQVFDWLNKFYSFTKEFFSILWYIIALVVISVYRSVMFIHNHTNYLWLLNVIGWLLSLPFIALYELILMIWNHLSIALPIFATGSTVALCAINPAVGFGLILVGLGVYLFFAFKG